jgi:DNA polymerase IV
VAKTAHALLAQLRSRRRVGVRLLGIGLSHFDDVPPAPTQLAFFAPPAPIVPDEPVENDRDRALTQALDRIRGRYGAKAIVPAQLIEGTREIGPRVEE